MLGYILKAATRPFVFPVGLAVRLDAGHLYQDFLYGCGALPGEHLDHFGITGASPDGKDILVSSSRLLSSPSVTILP
jgi:hypothetical protein